MELITVGAEQTPLVSYLLGFAMIQYLVIAGGTKAMQLLGARSTRIQDLATRSGAAFATITGGVFLAMNLA